MQLTLVANKPHLHAALATIQHTLVFEIASSIASSALRLLFGRSSGLPERFMAQTHICVGRNYAEVIDGTKNDSFGRNRSDWPQVPAWCPMGVPWESHGSPYLAMHISRRAGLFRHFSASLCRIHHRFARAVPLVPATTGQCRRPLAPCTALLAGPPSLLPRVSLPRWIDAGCLPRALFMLVGTIACCQSLLAGHLRLCAAD
jgi:hypothetical protein